MNEKTKKDLVNQSEEGRKLFSVFVQDRIKTGKINLWAPVKKGNLLTWKTNAKVIKVKAKDTIIQLKEDRNLFARLAMVCKSRPEIDIQLAYTSSLLSQDLCLHEMVPRCIVLAGVWGTECEATHRDVRHL